MLVQTHSCYQRIKYSISGPGFSECSSKPVSVGAVLKDVTDGGHSLSEGGANGEKNAKSDELNAPNKKKKTKNSKVISKSNKFMQALSLPTICNMNPRSVYNKVEEFHAFIEEEEVDLWLMSESWERDNLTLDQIIRLENHSIIPKGSQRTGKGV